MKGYDVVSMCLSVEDVNVSIRNRQILSNITFNIGESEIIGLLGPNGSGKTTTIKTIAGLIKKESGKIKASGYSLDDNFEEYIRYLGFGFDKANYYPDMSGFDNLKFFTNTYRKCSNKEILKCAEQVGLSRRINDKVSKYSFGMRQRLNFAKSILTSAKLIVLDEPFNGVDPAGIIEMRELILNLKKENGTSFLISSHLLDEIESISDKLIFFKGGKILNNIDVENYSTYIHYIGIANPNDLLEKKLIDDKFPIELIDENVLKACCCEADLNSVILWLQNNNYIITSISSKRAIEDLYLKIVGGAQID